MLLPIHPPDPSPALLDALVATGFQPVPVSDIDDIIERSPEPGWAPAVIEVQRDLGSALAFAAKIAEEANLPVL